MTLGLCMIVKDEEEVLGRCLQSVQGVFDEIYITDTGSHDQTPRIAAQFTPFVFRFPWRQDFAAARNASFAPARTDYIMWLDADDVLLPQARQALLALKPRLGEADCWYLRYDAAFDAHGNVTLHFRRERIVRRSCGFVWEGAVHETLQVSGTAAQADISVTHLRAAHKEQGRNLRIFARLFADGKTPCSRQKYYFARELEDSGLYDTAACAYEWFLRGSGWAEDKICACRGLARCHAACGRRQEQLEALLRSFAYAPPRAETCCCVGRFFWKKEIGSRRSFGSASPCAPAKRTRADSSAPTRAATSPTCGCACVTTSWETSPAPAPATSLRGAASRMTKTTCTTRAILPRWNKRRKAIRNHDMRPRPRQKTGQGDGFALLFIQKRTGGRTDGAARFHARRQLIRAAAFPFLYNNKKEGDRQKRTIAAHTGCRFSFFI